MNPTKEQIEAAIKAGSIVERQVWFTRAELVRAITAALAQAAAPASGKQDLHDAIMHIPCCPYRTEPDFVTGYKFGHRDARHAAAELAQAAAPAGDADLLREVRDWRRSGTSLPNKIEAKGSIGLWNEWAAALWSRIDATLSAPVAQPAVSEDLRELLREARDNAIASTAEEDISADRRAYRRELAERLNAARNALATPIAAAVPDPYVDTRTFAERLEFSNREMAKMAQAAAVPFDFSAVQAEADRRGHAQGGAIRAAFFDGARFAASQAAAVPEAVIRAVVYEGLTNDTPPRLIPSPRLHSRLMDLRAALDRLAAPEA